jgi:hypothetical protein
MAADVSHLRPNIGLLARATESRGVSLPQFGDADEQRN